MQNLIKIREEAMQQLADLQKISASTQAEIEERKNLIHQIFDLDMQLEYLQRGDRI